jgi:hypothetical protein
MQSRMRILLVATLLAVAGAAAAQPGRAPRPPQTTYAEDMQTPPPRIQPAATQPTAATQGSPPVSACAALPETGPVPRPAGPVMVPARPTPEHGLHCDAPFRLDISGRMPQCVRPGIKVVDGNPREMCAAAMPLGPIADVAPRSRPTRSCTAANTETIVRLEGANLGWADVTIIAVPDRGITLTTLADTSDNAPETENPVLQGCFAYQCRLVKLSIDSTAASQIELRATLPGHDYQAVMIKLPIYCPH